MLLNNTSDIQVYALFRVLYRLFIYINLITILPPEFIFTNN